MTSKKTYIIKSSDRDAHSFKFEHPLGEGGSELIMTMLARPTGLTRLVVNLARVPPGQQAFVHHRHHAEEEWVFILEGAGRCDIDDEKTDVAPGDFIAFPTGTAHSIENTGPGDLVYLMGGEQTPVEVADFPRHGKRMLRAGNRSEIVDAEACDGFYPEIEPLKTDSE